MVLRFSPVREMTAGLAHVDGPGLGAGAGEAGDAPWAVSAWTLSFPSQNSPSWLPKPRLYASQSR